VRLRLLTASPMQFACIAVSKNQPIAELLVSLLRSGGCHPLPVAASSHIDLAGADHGFFVQVPQREAARAIRLLRGLRFDGVTMAIG